MQPQISTVLCLAEGTSVVTEGVWDNRFRYVDELRRMGADISVDGKVAVVEGTGPDHVPELYLMQQATQMIPQMEPGYHMDAVLRVKNCLYAHYTGPMSHSQLASSKLQILAFENDIKLSGNTYTIFVNQDDDEAVVDVFMETK